MSENELILAADIERETTLAIDLVRKWRSRYGWPIPLSQDGQTGYSREQVLQLKLIRRLLDGGFRPSQVIGRSLSELERLSHAVVGSVSPEEWSPFTQHSIRLLIDHALPTLEAHLEAKLEEVGLATFVKEYLGPLTVAIGEAWQRGDIQVHQEHLASSLLTHLLQGKIYQLSRVYSGQRVLLATPPDELHLLGLLMVQAVLCDAHIPCIMLGANVPLRDMIRAVNGCQADVLALSFSFSYPPRKIRPVLEHLREHLPAEITIWAGGAGLKNLPSLHIPGVECFSSLDIPINMLKTTN